MNDEIIKTLRNMAITKQLNFLLGSGTSVPAIPLMGTFKDTEEKSANQLLTVEIQEVSKKLLSTNTSSETNNNQASYEKIYAVKKYYQNFIESIVIILNLSNSRQTPKNVNIFTTNYDLFLESATEYILKKYRLVFNDGASGYFNRYLDSSNFNRTVSYRGLNDNYTNEIPSITLIKPHGSVNWEKQNEKLVIKNTVVDKPVIVIPDGRESATTFENNHFHEMLRVFQLELDKPQSVLFVIGFSFQDKHIAKMVLRAVQNPELMVYIFGYTDADKNVFLNNLNIDSELPNLKILTPQDIPEKYVNIHT